MIPQPKKNFPSNRPSQELAQENPKLPSPDGQQRRLVSATVSQSISFSGPMPHPSLLREYEAIVPGSAKRIMDTFERQGLHRQEIEKKVIASDIRGSSQGRWFGFIIVMTTLGVCLWLGLTGHDVVSLIGIISGLGALVGVFVVGSQKRVEERLKKAKIQTKIQQEEASHEDAE